MHDQQSARSPQPEPTPVPARDAGFAAQFERELLASARLRVTLLAGLFFAFFLLTLVNTFVFHVRGIADFGGPAIGIAVATLLLGLTAQQLVARRFIERRLAQGRAVPSWMYFLNAAIETSSSTLTLVLIMPGYAHPIAALDSPAVMGYFIFIVLATLRLDWKICMFTALVAAVEYLGLAAFIVSRTPAATPVNPLLFTAFHHAQKALVLIAAGAVAAFVANEIRRRIYRSLRTVEERDRILSIFGQHTAPSVVSELIGGKAALDSQRREVCIMFLDLRGYTSYSENRSPEQVVDFLNRFFDIAIAAVNHRNGIIHQLLGDGFMAIFGAPASSGNDCQNAVDAALDIIRTVQTHVSDGRLPATQPGIGLHAGEVVAGMVGSAIHREYKVTGDVVNVAARIEKLNKKFASSLIVSDRVLQRLHSAPPEAHALGSIRLRGRQAPTRIFRLA